MAQASDMGETQPSMYQTCLMHTKADRNMRSMVSAQLAAHKLTMMEWLLLGIISEAPESGLSVSQLADSANVSMPQITTLTGHLLRDGLIKQEAHAADKRARITIISDKGKEVIQALEDSLRITIKDWLADIPKAELDVYNGVVAKLASHKPSS